MSRNETASELAEEHPEPAPGAPARKLRVLILDAGRQCLPFLRSLRKAGHHVTVACSSRLSCGYMSRYASRRVMWPDYFADPEGFTERMLAYLREHKPDVTLAVGDISAGILARNKDEVTAHTRVTVPDLEVFDRAADKAQTMAFCMEHDIPCPKSFSLEESDLETIIKELSFPVMVKPRRGIGAIGLQRFTDAESLRRGVGPLAESYGELLVQELIPIDGGTQFQAEAFVGADGEMKCCMVILKPRFFPVAGGTSTANQTIDRPDIQETVRRLLEGISWTGAGDVDLILDPRDGVPKVLEINPRVTAGIKIGFAAGIDYADLHVRHAMGEAVPEVGSYKLGVYSRNLIMDVLWFLFSDREGRKATPLPFFRFFGRDVCYQTIAWDDPTPFLGFFLGMVRKYSSPKVWRAKLGRDVKVEDDS